MMTISTILQLPVVTALLIAGGYANAAPMKQMPIDFVGEWCSPSKDGNSTEWSLPSWALGDEGDGKCTDILSVEKWGFYGFNNETCIPAEIKTKSDTAPSGTAYMATVKANCTKDQQPPPGPIKVFEFQRYKGHLTIKTK